MKKKFKNRNFFYFFFSTVILFYLVEIYLIFNKDLLFNENKKKLNRFSKNLNSKDFDFRSSYEVLVDYRKQGFDPVLTIGPTNFLNSNDNIFPLSGISNKLTICCNELGYYMVYKSDRYGFNNPDEVWDLEEIDYLIIGDSYVHGQAVNRPDDISSVLRKRYKVINIGYSGTGALIQYASLKEYFKKTKNVLWFFSEFGDLDDLKNELNNDQLIKYLDNNYSQNLKLRHKEIDAKLNKFLLNFISYQEKLRDVPQDKFLWIKQTIKLYKTRVLIKNFSNKEAIKALVPIKEINYSETDYEKFENLFNKINKLTQNNNAKLHFVYMPSFYRYNKTANFENLQKNIKKIVQANNITFIDIHTEFFSKKENPLNYFPITHNKHYTPEAYFEIANLID